MIDKKDAAVFRCTLSGQSLHRWLKIPAWMFDRAVSASWRITNAPREDLAALGALASLLQDTDPLSQSAEMGAALSSHDANRGDVHAAQPTTPQFDLFLKLNDAKTVQHAVLAHDTENARVVDGRLICLGALPVGQGGNARRPGSEPAAPRCRPRVYDRARAASVKDVPCHGDANTHPQGPGNGLHREPSLGCDKSRKFGFFSDLANASLRISTSIVLRPSSRSRSQTRSSSRRTSELPTTGSSDPTAAAPPSVNKRRQR